MRKLWKDFNIEIITASVVLLGVFLMVEPFEIRKTVFGWISELIRRLDQFGAVLFASVTRLTLSDAIGLVLIVGAGVFIVWRARYHFLRSFRWVANECPLCGSPLRRVHRSWLDRVFGAVLLPHSRRYRCKNPDCHWTGLRHGGPHHLRLPEDEA